MTNDGVDSAGEREGGHAKYACAELRWQNQSKYIDARTLERGTIRFLRIIHYTTNFDISSEQLYSFLTVVRNS
jgi:hypothetical protein